jgi:hypothetical protein
MRRRSVSNLVAGSNVIDPILHYLASSLFFGFYYVGQMYTGIYFEAMPYWLYLLDNKVTS